MNSRKKSMQDPSIDTTSRPKDRAMKWSNWSGSVQVRPAAIVYPESIEEVSALVKHCRQDHTKLRVAGSGHSFTPLVETDDTIISLDKLAGVVEVDAEANTVTVWAGTKLRQLGRLLFERGYAQENLGDIDAQSIAGAISTGTHGTGSQFGNLSTQVEELLVVLGTGDVMRCSEHENRPLFKALQVSLGTIGIIVQVKLRVLKAYKLVYESHRMPLTECMSRLDEFKEHYRHVEFYAFPYSDTVQVKLMAETDESTTKRRFSTYFNDIVVENWAFGLLSRACRAAPSLCRPASRFSAKNVPVSKTVAYSHEMFATPRLVRFNEMEYNIPAAQLGNVVRGILDEIESQQIPVHFPIKCRFARADDIWLSPAYERESAYIAVHMFQGMPYEAYFRSVAEIVRVHEGRPHWGKMHYLSSAELAKLYPRWTDFLRHRQQADPDDIFVTPYFEQLFALAPNKSSNRQF